MHAKKSLRNNPDEVQWEPKVSFSLTPTTNNVILRNRTKKNYEESPTVELEHQLLSLSLAGKKCRVCGNQYTQLSHHISECFPYLSSLPQNWDVVVKFMNSAIGKYKHELPEIWKEVEIRGVKGVGKGLFWVGDNVKENTVIAEYSGIIKRHFVEYNGTSRYLITSKKTEKGEYISVDAEKGGNETRYINDFRGLGEVNVAFVTSEELIFVVTLKTLEKDEQLLVDYGEEYWKSLNISWEQQNDTWVMVNG